MAVTYALGVQMLLLAKVAGTAAEARAQLERSIASGAALQKFGEMIAAQGGDARVTENLNHLPHAKFAEPLLAAEAGHVTDVDAMAIALAALRLGAGRARAEDRVDHAVGISGLVKIGEHVNRGAPLCVIHANDETSLAEAKARVAQAIVVGAKNLKATPLIDEIIGA
jgi:thymidine phosphorylase